MPNAFYVAKRAWENGDPHRALDLLVGHLAGHGVLDPFGDPASMLDHPSPHDFEEWVAALMTATLPNSAQTVLQVPLARVWVPIFELDPAQHWIDALLAYDFHPAPRALGADDQEHTPPAHSSADLEYLAEALFDAARTGLLSPDPLDRLLGGRPVLPPAELDDVDTARWRELLPVARIQLSRGYAAAPASPWRHLLEADPHGVAERFVHDMVGRKRTSPRAVATRWSAIRNRSPEHAETVLTALRTVLADKDYDVHQMVKIDAGQIGQSRVWLEIWLESLESGDGAPPA